MCPSGTQAGGAWCHEACYGRQAEGSPCPSAQHQQGCTCSTAACPGLPGARGTWSRWSPAQGHQAGPGAIWATWEEGCGNRGCSAWRGGGTWGAPPSTEQSSGVPSTRGRGPGHKLDPRRLFSGGGEKTPPEQEAEGVCWAPGAPCHHSFHHRPLL